jgi:hypothetical protein
LIFSVTGNLFLAATTLLDLQVDRRARQEIVERHRVAVLEEDSVVGDLLLGWRHVCLNLHALLQLLNGFGQADGDGQRLTVQLPLGFVGNIRDLDLDGDGSFVVGHEDVFGDQVVLLASLLVGRLVFRHIHDRWSWSEWRHAGHLTGEANRETRWSWKESKVRESFENPPRNLRIKGGGLIGGPPRMGFIIWFIMTGGGGTLGMGGAE